MTILIDNGHGSDTPGKRSPDGLFREYSYTREIAHRVVSELSDCGYDARLLVPEIVDIPLMERCRRANIICDEVARPMSSSVLKQECLSISSNLHPGPICKSGASF